MQSITENLNKVGDLDQAVAFKAVHALRFECYKLLDPGRRDDRAAFAKALATELNATVVVEPPEEEKKKKKDKDRKAEIRPKYDARTRNVILRCLSVVAGGAEVPEIVKAMGDLNLREMARYALDRNTGAAATAALVEALEGCGSEFRVGVINSLGRKGGPVALDAVREMSRDPDPQVRLAAIEALSKFPDAANDEIMARAGRIGSERARARVAKARIRLAESLKDHGDEAAAKEVYQSIPRDMPAQRKAADMALKSAR